MVYKKKKWEYLKRLFTTLNRKKNVPVAEEEVIDDVLLGLYGEEVEEVETGIKQGL